MAPVDLQDRFPVNTLDDAVRWLWTYTDPCEWLWAVGDAMPNEALLVCDAFWITPSKLVQRMRAEYDAVAGRTPARARVRQRQRFAMLKASV